MYRKKYLIIIIMVIYTAFFTGCYPDGKTIYLPISDFNDIEKQDNLFIDLVLPNEYPNQLPTLYMESFSFSRQCVFNLFVKGKMLIEEESGEKMGYYKAKNDITMFKNNLMIFRRTEDLSESQSTLSTMIGSVWENKIFSDQELSFSKKSAKEKIDRLISELKIENIGDPDVYSVSCDNANTIYDNFFLNEKGDRNQPIWSSDDDVYIFNYPLMYSNVNISVYDTNKHKAPHILAVISKDGVVFFQCKNICTFRADNTEMIQINVSPSQALEIVCSRFINTVILKPTSIFNCNLVYITSNKQNENEKLIPAWQFSYSEYDEVVGIYNHRQVYVNANTGDII